MPAELGREFDLDTVLRFGSLPVVWESTARKDALAAYVQTYLKEEIQAEALVRNLPGFARFLSVATLFHAQVLSVSSLARDSGVARVTVQGYADRFEDWFHWAPADAARTKVDFLLRRDREWIAIEAKSSNEVGDAELKGLRAIADPGGLVRRILVCNAARRRTTSDGIDIWHVAALLEALEQSSLWP